jgi:hypothetical protein
MLYRHGDRVQSQRADEGSQVVGMNLHREVPPLSGQGDDPK